MKVSSWKWSNKRCCIIIFDDVHVFCFQAIKRDMDLYEQAKAAEQRPAGSPVDAEQSDTLDTNKLPDLFLQPLRCVSGRAV